MSKAKLVEVRQNHLFNITKLENWIKKNCNNLGKILSLKQFIGGQSNPTFLINFNNNESCILRKKPPGNLLPSAHAIEREYLLQKALQKTSIPCPIMIALCEDEKIIGTPFYLMRLVKGDVYDSVLEIKNVKKRKDAFLNAASMLGELHNVKYKSVNLDAYGKGEGYVPRQIQRWQKQWYLSKQRELPEINKIIQWLNANLPNDDSSSIVHGDFRLGNLIYDENTADVKAILDWELSTIGHPFSDIGYLLHTHYVPAGQRHGLKGLDLIKENLPTTNEIIREYCRVREIKFFDPTFYIILSMFRSIAILEGVYARYINGNASSPNAKDIGRDVEPLSKATFNIIRRL